ncbi:uncharacterized protein EI97DRAFT_461772 [Westerdykella ornata]|uniref:Uncharacterized protein n=1 Tax=Westerdykella ornata TaxID=318751 RepID=A0A6A6J921_WESOR|nr:uncharacterized protein EI97DRAFT_461772 [Westerdykella ornata]KAF2272673.1 hypothetical protein EI97DRAFT_461772 [Westerdykella ornata]
MYLIRRSGQPAWTLLRLPAPIVCGSRRAFSQSHARERGSLPVYLTPSKPELSIILSQLNSKVLLPLHLTKDQAKLVFKPENKARLEASDPIEITLGNVTLPLEHIDRNRDQPSQWGTIKTIIEKAESSNDWENVIRMLEGVRSAGIRLWPFQWEKIVRSLHVADMQHLVVKAVQRAGKTGLRLRHSRVIHALFLGFHERAARSEWDPAITAKMLDFVEEMVYRMEGKEHLGREPVTPNDIRASPFTIAYPAELAAARAKVQFGGEDKDRKVRRYASRLMNAITQTTWGLGVLKKDLDELKQLPTGTQEEYVTFQRTTNHVLQYIVVWNALRTANQVLGDEMPSAEKAQTTEKKLGRLLLKAVDTLKEKRSNLPVRVEVSMTGCQKL